MRLLIETSGGGGVVLVVAMALIAGGNGAISAAAVAILITIAVLIAVSIAAVVGLVVYRARREWQPVQTSRRAAGGFTAPVVHEVRPHLAPPALEAPAVRLHPDQLAELARILRHEETQ